MKKKYGLPKVKNRCPAPKMKSPKSEFSLLDNIKYEINTQIDPKKCIIKIRENYLNTISNSIINLKNKEVIKVLHKLGWRNDKWEEEFNDILNYENTTNGGYSEWVELENNNLSDLLTKWITKKLITSKPVKVKCKDGMIQIKRIDNV